MKLFTTILLTSACAALAATEEQTNKTFSVSSGGTLVVDVEFGSIEVSGNSDGKMEVDVWRKVSRRTKADEQQFLRDHAVKFIQDGDTVTIQCRYKQEKHGWFNWGVSGNRNEARYQISVPAQFNAELKTSGGPISIVDLTGKTDAKTSGGGLKFARLTGPLRGGTSGGGIHVEDCKGEINISTSGGGIRVNGGGGSLKGDTSGGAVTVAEFKGPVSVETSGGGINIQNVKGRIKGETSGGPIHAVLISPIPGEVSLSTSGGGVTVEVAPDAAFSLDARTSGGSVSSDLPVTVQGKMEHSELKGVVNGGGPAVVLCTSGGSIRVRKP